jgi:hypothetical protein
VRELPPVRGAAAALVLIAFGAGTAAGQNRPLLTEPALTARAGTLVFETGMDAIAAEPSYITGRPGRPTLGARFGVVLPQTEFEDEQFRPLGLGPNSLRAFAEALFSQPIGPVRLDVNAGLLIFDEVLRPHEQRDFLVYGLALEWRARPALSLLAEMAGRAGDGMPGAELRSEARLGLRVGGGRLRGDAALRRGLTADDGTWGVTLGLTWTAREPGRL